MFINQFKNVSKLPSLLSVMTALGFYNTGGVYAESASIEVPASITVNNVLLIIDGDPLSFGTATVDGSNGTVAISAISDEVINSNGVVSVDETNAHRGFFIFISPDAGSYNVTIDKSVELEGGRGNTLLLLPSLSTNVITSTVAGEAIIVHFGGNITLSAGTRAGLYSGSIRLTMVGE